MAQRKAKVVVVHDETGRIVSIARPPESANVIVLSGDGQSTFETEVEVDAIDAMVSGKYVADVSRKAVVAVKK